MALPTGTVTFLFTDIEGSTRLLDELGAERYAEALAEHRRLLREAFAAHDGVEVDTQGDAFFVAFPAAAGALEAAAQAQGALAGSQVRVRMGIHSGEPLVTAEGYVGMDVHRGARVMSAGHGGQVLVSEATHVLVDGDGRLHDLGLHRLKDLTAPQRLWQLGDGDFPPLKTLYQTNLPIQPTPLVGRERELGDVLDLLRRERLVTLTGAGGSGKTRLALQAAAELRDDFKDGVWWVSLAALRDPTLVEPTIAGVVGAEGNLGDHLGGMQTLLLLDNFEQVLDAAPVIAALLARSTDLHVLVTSRERLALAAEHEYLVPTLELSEAVALFTARARQSRPDFEPDDAVAQICLRLDGLPLAIELAAARVRLLSPDQLHDRLEESLALLTSGRRDAPERQQTLRATIEWSYELLSHDEQRSFETFAVFPGSFTIEAAQAVSGMDLDVLEALVDKSLVRQTDAARLFLLETIRAFAREALVRSGGADEVKRRHLAFFDCFSQETALALVDHHDATTLNRLDAERDNLRAAVSAAADFGDFGQMAAILVRIGSRWIWAGGDEEMRRWMELALERIGGDQRDLRADLLAGLGDIAFARGDWDTSDRMHTQALEVLGGASETPRTAMSLVRLAQASLLRGDCETARERAGQAAAAATNARYRRGETIARSLLGDVALREGAYGRARELFAEAAERFRKQGDDSSLALVLNGLAYAELRESADDRAAVSAREMLSIQQRIGDTFPLVHAVELLAALLARQDKADTAAIVLASAAAIREQHGWDLQPLEQELHDETLAAIERLGSRAEFEDHDEPPPEFEEVLAMGLAALD